MKGILKGILDLFKGSKEIAFPLLFAAILEETKKFKDRTLQAFVEQKLDPIREIAELFTDDNKNNKEQLRAWWEANKERLIDDHLLIAAQMVGSNKKMDVHTRGIIVQQLVTLAAQNWFKTDEEIQAFVVRHVQAIAAENNLPIPLMGITVTPAIEPVRAVAKEKPVRAKKEKKESPEQSNG